MMSREEAIKLLAVITCYDNRNAGEGSVLAWCEASRRGDWTFEEALDAVHAHYAEETTFLMVAHVTHHVRARRAEEHRQARLPEWCGQCGNEWTDNRARGNARWRFHTNPETGEQNMCVCHPQSGAAG